MTYETFQIVSEPRNYVPYPGSKKIIIIEVDRILTYEDGADRSNEIWLGSDVVAYQNLKIGDYVEVDTGALRTRDFCDTIFSYDANLVRFKSHGEFVDYTLFQKRCDLFEEVRAWRKANSTQRGLIEMPPKN